MVDPPHELPSRRRSLPNSAPPSPARGWRLAASRLGRGQAKGATCCSAGCLAGSRGLRRRLRMRSATAPRRAAKTARCHAGAQLDRNGLRPARVLLTDDGLLAMMSETGVVDALDENVIWKGRLGPGLQITMDLETGEIRKCGRASRAAAATWPACSRAAWARHAAHRGTVRSRRPS